MTTFKADTVNVTGSTFTDIGQNQYNYTLNFGQNAGPNLSILSSSLPAFNDVPLDLLSVHFTGRDKELERILLILKVLHGNVPTRCGLFGMHGVGKSQVTFGLAKETFAQGLYTNIFWIPATTVEKLYQGFCKLLHLVDHPDRSHPEQSVRLTAARRWLEEYDAGRWLLVLDNVERETVEFLREHLPRKNSLGNILFTTRTEAVAKALTNVAGERHEIVELRIPDVEDASKLLLQHLEDSEVEDDMSMLQEVVKCVGCLPLAIAQIAAYIKETGSMLDDMLSLFQSKHKVEVINWENDLLSYQEKSIAATFTCQLKDLEKQSPDASRFLKILVYLDPESISLDMLTTCAASISNSRESQAKEETRAGETGNTQIISARMATLLAIVQSPTRLQSAITQLQNRSLVKRQGRARSSSLWIHDVVRLVVSEYSKLDGDEQDWFESAMNLICSAFEQIGDPASPDSWPQCEILIPHIQSLEKHEMSINARSLLLANRGVTKYLYSRGRYDEAEKLVEQVLQGAERLFGSEHLDTLSTMRELAWIYRMQGKVDEAGELLERAVRGHEKEFGSEHVSTLWAMHDLAVIRHDQGRYREAEVLLDHVLPCREKQLGLDDVNTIWSMFEMGGIYRCQGRYREGEEIFKRVLLLQEKCLGADHIYAVWTTRELACTYRDGGRYREAETLLDQVLLAEEKQLGADHVNTLWSTFELAGVYRGQERHREAEVLLERVLKGREGVLGSEHPSTLAAKHELGAVYRCQERYAEAETLLVHVLRHREKCHGVRHPHTRSTMELLAQVYEGQGRMDEAQTMSQRATQSP